MKFLRNAVAGVAVSAALLLAGAPGASARDHDHDWSKIHVLFLIWSFESNPFFEPMVHAVTDAQQDQGIKVDVQYGDEDLVKMNNILETAIASGVDGIDVVISDDNGLKDVLCRATKQGIPVVAFNIDDSRHGAPGSTCRLAFVGQDFDTAGYVIGQRMIKDFHLGKGDLVFTPVEAPQAVYAVHRHAGVAKALAEVGARTEMLGTGNDQAQALTLMTQYLVGHPDTKAVIGLGYTPTSVAVAAIQAAGMKIPAGGFDVGKDILQNILDGSLDATVDQQPYTQGYYAVTELAHRIKYGLFPSDMNTGGFGLIDKSTAAPALKWAAEIR